MKLSPSSPASPRPPPSFEFWVGAATHGPGAEGQEELCAIEARQLTQPDDQPLLRHLQAILEAACLLGVTLPTPFLFHAGQVFYRKEAPVEVRLEGFTHLSSAPPLEGAASTLQGTRWSTGGPLLFSVQENAQLVLDPAVQGLPHRSAATVVQEAGLFLLVTWQLGEPPTTPQLNLPFSSASGPSSKTGKATRRLRSVMSQVPVPRKAAQSAASLSLIRGLGRMFSGYNELPHLGLQDPIPTHEARRIFWGHLTAHLEEALRGHTPHAYWEQITRDNQATEVILHGVPGHEARSLWASLSRSLNKGEGGPGIQVAEPEISSATHWDASQGHTVVASRWLLWPERALRDKEGWEVAPVQFRTEGSPGYVELLRRHGAKPFFANGWLWIPRGQERDGFRIGGLSTLLFPEGREALERIKQRELQGYEEKLNQIFQKPELYPEREAADQAAARDLRAAIQRVKRWLATLTVFDVQDVILCIFEAFHRQRDAWVREQLTLPDGRRIETRPWRLLYLDPNDMRIRLDPAQRWGENWRAHIFDKLEALTTFSRQTRTSTGRKVDVGDRFLTRAIDALRPPEEHGSELDPTLAVAHLLQRNRAFPLDAFLVEVSLEFMQRLVTFATNPEGVVRWGLHAADAVQEQAEREGKLSARQTRALAQSTKDEARSKPTYDHSPRLMALGNLEHWSAERKQFAYVLLQEVTPRQERSPHDTESKHALVVFDNEKYLCCNGSLGHGYLLTTWMQKAGYDRMASERSPGRYAAFVEDLDALSKTIGLRLQLKDSEASTAEVLRQLHRERNPSRLVARTVLRLYVPADLEERLRKRLADEGIDAIDDHEASRSPSLMLQKQLPPRPLTPAELHAARVRSGLTQAQLAERLGVTKMMISHWESGKKTIAAERLAQLYEVLAGALASLLTHEETDPAPG